MQFDNNEKLPHAPIHTMEAKLNARTMYPVLVNHVLSWMGSYQGLQLVSRAALMSTLRLDDDQLNEAIAVIKDFSASQGWPSVTTVIERDQTIRAHDVLTQLNRLLGSAARILPSRVHDTLVTVNDDLEEWVVDLQSVTGSGYVGTHDMVLKHKFRKTDLDLLPEHFAGLL